MGLVESQGGPAGAQPEAEPGHPPAVASAILDESEEAAHLLRRAAEAAERQDWKLAIDALQRIVELPGETIVQAAPDAYESARRHAHRQIAALPPEGLRAYRLLHDGEARTCYHRAVEMHDETALREIVDRFLLTSVGDDAAMTLASWWLDEGRASPAIALLRELATIYPDPDVPRAAIEARLALAMGMAGQRQAARKTTEALVRTSQGAGPLQQRAMEIQAGIGQLMPAAAGPEPAWSMVMGGPQRTGLMPPVEPTLLDETPWRHRMPIERPGLLPKLDAFQRTTRWLPVTQMVTNGQVVIINWAGRLIALDADTFEKIWETLAAPLPGVWGKSRYPVLARRAGPAEAEADFEWDALAHRLFRDEAAGSLVLHAGLVITIERSAEEIASPEEQLRRAAEPAWRQAGAGPAMDQIVAYDARTGRLRWRCGRSARTEPGPGGKSAGPLDDAEFLSAPIPVRDHLLLVPYRSGTDLHAAIVEDTGGMLVRTIYLCGLGGADVAAAGALPPCLADEVAYIPTDCGALIALDTATWAIRWAVRYERDAPGARTISPEESAADRRVRADPPAGGWQPGPPVAAAGLVLLAPGDADSLLAFDRATGTIAWKLPRGDGLYVLAADPDPAAAWVVGDTVRRVDLETGHVLWERRIGHPTGRGALSGGRLYLPTTDHVAVLDAQTGEPAGRLELPDDGRPLGNLVCWDGYLYSLDVQEIRRYPDLRQAYEAALAAHRNQPAKAGPAIRLAHLELIRRDPERALVALEGVRTDGPDGHGDRHSQAQMDHVAHLRVEALLAMARRPETPTSRAEEYLRAARWSARRPDDAVRAGLALAEHLAAGGRTLEAYREYVGIALAGPEAGGDATGGIAGRPLAPGDVLIKVSGGARPVRRAARGVIRERLQELERQLDASGRQGLEAWLAERLGSAFGPGQGDPDLMERLAEVRLPGGWGLRAMMRLGVLAQEDERIEEAEYHYRRVLRSGAPPPAAAEALARLAQVYMAPDELHMPLAAESCIERLRSEFASVSIPAGAVRRGATGGITGAEAAAALEARLDRALLERHRAATRDIRLGAPTNAVYSGELPDAMPLLIRSARPEPLADTMLLLAGTSEVRAHRVADGEVLWRAALRLIEEPEVFPEIAPSVVIGTPYEAGAPAPRPYAVHDGQVLVVNSERGLHGIGLATGLRLWSRRFILPEEVTTATDAILSSEEGQLLTLDGNGVLAMASTIDGGRIRWEREVPGEQWAAIRLRDRYAVLVDRSLSVASVFRAEDGRHLGDASFSQPRVAEARRISLAIFGEVICGPAGPADVVARELAAPGVERWRLRCEQGGKPASITGLFRPRPDVLGIGCAGGTVRLVDPRSGHILLEADLKDPGAEPFEGAMTDDVLCVYSTGGAKREGFRLVAIDTRSGDVLWHRPPQPGEYWSPPGFALPISNELLAASSNAIPIARIIPGRQGHDAGVRSPGIGPDPSEAGTVQLTILDKRTGQPIGEPQRAALTRAESMRRIRSVLVWPDRIVVVGDSAYVAFGVEERAP